MGAAGTRAPTEAATWRYCCGTPPQTAVHRCSRWRTDVPSRTMVRTPRSRRRAVQVVHEAAAAVAVAPLQVARVAQVAWRPPSCAPRLGRPCRHPTLGTLGAQSVAPSPGTGYTSCLPPWGRQEVPTYSTAAPAVARVARWPALSTLRLSRPCRHPTLGARSGAPSLETGYSMTQLARCPRPYRSYRHSVPSLSPYAAPPSPRQWPQQLSMYSAPLLPQRLQLAMYSAPQSPQRLRLSTYSAPQLPQLPWTGGERWIWICREA